MRPDAASFSPCNDTPSSINSCTAIVPVNQANAATSEYGRIMSDSGSSKSMKETPHNMIIHESIKGLLQQVADLNLRCNGLETAVVELKSEIATLKEERSVNGTHGVLNGAQHFANGTHQTCNGNVTGYASSSNGSGDWLDTTSEHERWQCAQINNLSVKVELFEEILGVYKQRIDAQAVQQNDFEKQSERKNQDQTALKGRVGRLEKDLKAFEEKFDEAGVNDNRSRTFTKNGSIADVASSLKDEIKQVQVRLADLTKGCQKNWDELEGKCNAIATVVENGPGEPRSLWHNGTSSDDSDTENYSKSKKDMVALKEWQRDERRKAKNKQVIDEASTRDALDAMFFQLTHIMGEDSGDTVCVEGPFETTSEEAFGLRDQVLVRLSLFDLYATALKEVQAKKGQVDW